MPKIKEIKKIESNIKEIKQEKKESLEEEIEDENVEEFAEFIGSRRLAASSTLKQSEVPQDQALRKRTLTKEDEAEVSFRPSYTGGGSPYKATTYTPVGSAESSGVGSQQQRPLGERNLGEQRDSQLTQNQQSQQQDFRNAGRPESSYERGEVNRDGQKERDRRRQMM